MKKYKANIITEHQKQKQIQDLYDWMYYGAAKAVASAKKHRKAEGQWTLRRYSFPYPKRNGFSGFV